MMRPSIPSRLPAEADSGQHVGRYVCCTARDLFHPQFAVGDLRYHRQHAPDRHTRPRTHIVRPLLHIAQSDPYERLAHALLVDVIANCSPVAPNRKFAPGLGAPEGRSDQSDARPEVRMWSVDVSWLDNNRIEATTAQR